MNEAAIVEEDTLENEVVDEPTEVSNEQPETPVESPDPTAKPEMSEEVEQYMNAKIGDYAFKQREAERQAQEEKKRIDELQAKLAEYEQTSRPNIPPAPDPFDDDYDKKVKERDNAILKAAEWDAGERIREEQRVNAEQAEQQRRQAEIIQRAQSYTENANNLGIKPEELQLAGNTIAQYGIHDDVAGFILDDDHGPAITMYLSKNPMELEQVRNMNPMQAAAYIATSVKEKAVASRPKAEAAPAPVETPAGPGMGEIDGLVGATFE